MWRKVLGELCNRHGSKGGSWAWPLRCNDGTRSGRAPFSRHNVCLTTQRQDVGGRGWWSGPLEMQVATSIGR